MRFSNLNGETPRLTWVNEPKNSFGPDARPNIPQQRQHAHQKPRKPDVATKAHELQRRRYIWKKYLHFHRNKRGEYKTLLQEGPRETPNRARQAQNARNIINQAM